MSEYIKKNAVLNKEFEAEINTYDGEYDSSVAYVVLSSDIYKMPAEDVAPVRHGYWKETSYVGVSRCSCCDKPSSTPDCLKKFHKYCPECGAKMDKLEE